MRDCSKMTECSPDFKPVACLTVMIIGTIAAGITLCTLSKTEIGVALIALPILVCTIVLCRNGVEENGQQANNPVESKEEKEGDGEVEINGLEVEGHPPGLNLNNVIVD